MQIGFVGDSDVARIVGLSVATVWRMTRAGSLPAPVKIGRRTLWRLDEVTEWVQQQTETYRAGGQSLTATSGDPETRQATMSRGAR